MLTLARALRVAPASYIAIAGAGGKTSALFTLAREVPRCAVTTTTHLGAWQTTQADRIWTFSPEAVLPDRLPDGVTFVAGARDPRANQYGAPPEAWLARLAALARAQSVPLFVEADGARGRPLKAPAAHEPVIPPEASIVLVVASMSGVGRPLDEANVHRADIFGRLSGMPAGAPVTPEAIVGVLAHVDGGLKNIPAAARRVVLLNQADSEESRTMAAAMALTLVPPFDSVVVSSGNAGWSADDGSNVRRLSAFQVREPVAGIVLAAGGARRFGRPKQVALYRGRPFVRVVAQTALAAGLSPVHVVVGAHGELVDRALEGLSVKTISNPDWEAGQAASVVAGVQALPAATSAAVFLQADQPLVPAVLVAALVERHAQGLFPIVAPLVDGRPLSPVLFDRATFADLLRLTGDHGGRALWDTWGVEGVAWHDRSVLLDIDTLDDYRAMTRETNS